MARKKMSEETRDWLIVGAFILVLVILVLVDYFILQNMSGTAARQVSSGVGVQVIESTSTAEPGKKGTSEPMDVVGQKKHEAAASTQFVYYFGLFLASFCGILVAIAFIIVMAIRIYNHGSLPT